MPFHPFILADADDLGKLVFGIIAVVIWGISALASALNKQKTDARRRAEEMFRQPEWNDPRHPPAPAPPPPPPLWEQMTQQRPSPAPRAPVRPRGPQPVPPPPPRVPSAKRPQQQKKKQPQQQRRAPSVPLLPLPAETPRERVSARPALDRRPSERAAQSSFTARQIRPLLRESLRRQIVINEILMPPVALRPPPEQ